MFSDLLKSYSQTDFAVELSHLFSDKNEFFVSGETKFFVENDDKFIGFYHPDYSYEGKPYVCFGYWNFNKQSCFEKNMERLRKWSLEKSVGQIIGPIDFSTLHNYRLPLNQFDQSFMGEPIGTLDQVHAVESVGFRNIQKYSSYYIEDPSKIYSWGQKRSQKILRQGATFRSISFEDLDFKKRKSEIYELIDRVFQSNVGYLKPNEHELDFLYNEKKLEQISRFPFFFVENEQQKLVGLFVSFIGANVFTKGSKECLYFKTIGAEPSATLHNPVFFFLIHEIYRTYESLNMKLPICFSLMRKGNVAEKVAKMFSDQSRSYALFKMNL